MICPNDELLRVRPRQVGMLQAVEAFRPELQLHRFAQGEEARDGSIQIGIRGTHKLPQPGIAEGAVNLGVIWKLSCAYKAGNGIGPSTSLVREVYMARNGDCQSAEAMCLK